MSKDNNGPKRMPEKTYEAGPVRATIWQNSGEKGPWYSTTITKNVRDSDGNFKEVSSYSKQDLERVSQVAGQAREFINEREQQQTTEAATSARGAAEQYGRAPDVQEQGNVRSQEIEPD